MQMLDFKMNEKLSRLEPCCVEYINTNSGIKWITF